MASLTFIQYHPYGQPPEIMRRVAKQGRPEMAPELRREIVIPVRFTESEAAQIERLANEWGMSKSAFIALMVAGGIRQLTESVNC